MPVELTTEFTSNTAAEVQWKVTSIAYTPEEYQVIYGLSMEGLNLLSSIVFGNSDIKSVNEIFDVKLLGLTPNTTYYYRVMATSAGGETVSDVASFITETQSELDYILTQDFEVA